MRVGEAYAWSFWRWCGLLEVGGYFDEDSLAEVAALDNSGAAGVAKTSLNGGSAPGRTWPPSQVASRSNIVVVYQSPTCYLSVETDLLTMQSVMSVPGSGKTVPILELPIELIEQIFDSITSSDYERYKILSAIARVNHHFQSIITPMLYRKVERCCSKHLQLFGRTVLTNKRYAELVKHYEGHRDTPVFNSTKDECPFSWSPSYLDEEIAWIAHERFSGLPVPVDGHDFSYSLACMLPCLQRLDLKKGGGHLIWHLDNLAMQATAPFQQLCTLEFAVEPDRAYPIHDISLLFTLPSLQALFIDMGGLNKKEKQMEGLENLWRCDRGSSTVQELTLRRCGLPVAWIAAIVASCQTLRQFHHEHYYWDYDADYYPHVVQALGVHQTTLTDVRLHELNGCQVDSVRQLDPSQPVSFRQFTSLAHLDIPLFSFSTRTHHCQVKELLPCSLETLTLDVRSAREGSSNTFFISLAEASPNCLSRMKSVEIVCRIEKYREEGFLPLHFCHLRRMFSSYGINFMYLLEFVQCEFKTGNVKQHTIPSVFPDSSLAYMKGLLSTLRMSGPDGCEMADRSSLEPGCLSKFYRSQACNSRSANAARSKRNWGYMQSWTGPSEFEMSA
jgi:hypothetical protein